MIILVAELTTLLLPPRELYLSLSRELVRLTEKDAFHIQNTRLLYRLICVGLASSIDSNGIDASRAQLFKQFTFHYPSILSRSFHFLSATYPRYV